MEETFDKLKKEGKNNVDSLVKWMQDSKLIEEGKASEDKTRQLFKDVDAKNVELQKFKEVVAKLAEEKKKSVQEFTKMLGDQGQKVMNAVMAGASALQDAMKK